jgi:hypothetical protein
LARGRPHEKTRPLAQAAFFEDFGFHPLAGDGAVEKTRSPVEKYHSRQYSLLSAN